jgi:N-acetylmuramoyl-L-alanine amidase
VHAFQEARGLHADGVCDEHTWAVLVEASWRLGDRLLYLRAPHLRGDDVADLQRRLGLLGFDAGRVDGIFGVLTGRALEDFQRNAGLHPDGICGYETVLALDRLKLRTPDGRSVASVREHERLLHGRRTLVGTRVVVGDLAGLAGLARGATRQLRAAGAVVVELDDPDPSAQARAANRFGSDCYLGLHATAANPTIAFYAVPGFESVGGRRLAELIHQRLDPLVTGLATPRGMRLPVLRETRMPAVLCELGPVRSVLDHAPVISGALGDALVEWAMAPT